jgi:hypothetical protein
MAVDRTVQIRVEGLKAVQRAVRALPKEVQDSMKAVHAAAAQPVVAEALARVPRRSGNLASTIRVSATRRAGRVMAGRASVPYAGVIHYGWPSRQVVFGKPTNSPVPIRPQPFLTDALRSRHTQVLSIYQRGIDRVVQVTWSRYANGSD